MINAPKFLFYVIAVCILAVVITFCVMAIVERDTTALVNNVVLAISAIVGLIIKRDENGGDNGRAPKSGDDSDTSRSDEDNKQVK